MLRKHIAKHITTGEHIHARAPQLQGITVAERSRRSRSRSYSPGGSVRSNARTNSSLSSPEPSHSHSPEPEQSLDDESNPDPPQPLFDFSFAGPDLLPEEFAELASLWEPTGDRTVDTDNAGGNEFTDLFEQLLAQQASAEGDNLGAVPIRGNGSEELPNDADDSSNIPLFGDATEEASASARSTVPIPVT